MSCKVATLGSLLIIRWQVPSLEDIFYVRKMATELEHLHLRKIMLVIIAPETLQIPSPELLDSVSRNMKVVTACCARHFFILEGAGVGRSFLRAFANALAIATGSTRICRIVGSVHEALLDAEPFTGLTVDATLDALRGQGLVS